MIYFGVDRRLAMYVAKMDDVLAGKAQWREVFNQSDDVRDIEPEVKSLEDVYLYTVDDLASVIQTGQALFCFFQLCEVILQIFFAGPSRIE